MAQHPPKSSDINLWLLEYAAVRRWDTVISSCMHNFIFLAFYNTIHYTNSPIHAQYTRRHFHGRQRQPPKKPCSGCKYVVILKIILQKKIILILILLSRVGRLAQKQI